MPFSTYTTRFKVMTNQGMFQPYLIPARSFTLHLGIQVEIIAAAALFDLSVYYITHPLNGKLYIHYIVKKRKALWIYLLASQLPYWINRPLTHVDSFVQRKCTLRFYYRRWDWISMKRSTRNNVSEHPYIFFKTKYTVTPIVNEFLFYFIFCIL